MILMGHVQGAGLWKQCLMDFAMNQMLEDHVKMVN